MPHSRGFATLGADQHGVRDLQRHRFLDHASLTSLTLRANMLFRYVEAFNNDLVDLRQCPRNGASFPFILAGSNQDGVTLLDIHLGKMERLLLFFFDCHTFPLTFVFVVLARRQTSTQNHQRYIMPTLVDANPGGRDKSRPYNTSGASEMIFIKFRSRNSRATGPKMRVPRGLLPAAIMTAAFSSKRICEPSERAYSFATRTTTALTTSPFFTCPLGAACLTEALITSPTSA